jgi:hypothetical protein
MNKTLLKGNAMTNDKQPDVREMIERGRKAAVNIAAQGIYGWGNTITDLCDSLEAALQSPSGAEVDGWRWVPVEPTEEMLDVFRGNKKPHPNGTTWESHYQNQYQKLLEAAPTPPSAHVKRSVPPGLIEALRDYQFQIDEDGTNIGVNRQAVYEAVQILTALSTSPLLDKNEKCETCNGHGMIGGFVRTGSGEGGYDGEPCPACTQLDKNDQAEGEKVDIDCTNMDAAHWAKAFCEKFPRHDEGLMVAWFANAIMCGWDNAHWKMEESNPHPPQPDSNELVEALHAINLCSQNTLSTKSECGRIARAALELRRMAESTKGEKE